MTAAVHKFFGEKNRNRRSSTTCRPIATRRSGPQSGSLDGTKFTNRGRRALVLHEAGHSCHHGTEWASSADLCRSWPPAIRNDSHPGRVWRCLPNSFTRLHGPDRRAVADRVLGIQMAPRAPDFIEVLSRISRDESPDEAVIMPDLQPAQKRPSSRPGGFVSRRASY